MWQTVKTFSEQKRNIFIPLTIPLANLKQTVLAIDLLAKRLYLLASLIQRFTPGKLFC